MRRLLLIMIVVAACSDATGTSAWTVWVTNQSDSAISVQAWNEANAGQIARFAYLTVPAHRSGCMKIDPITWGTSLAALQTDVWINNTIPPGRFGVFDGVDL